MAVPASPVPASPVPAAPSAPEPRALRAADSDREAAAQRLQEAFAERRIDGAELDERMHAALTARTTAELDDLTADLPAARVSQLAAPGDQPAAAGDRTGRLAVAWKGTITRAGNWRVPRRLTSVVYKGSGRIDLTEADLTAAVTTIGAVAYKSRVAIVLPPGLRVEVSGIGVSHDYPAGTPAPGAPVLRISGLAYKGGIDVGLAPVPPLTAPQPSLPA